MIKCTEFTALDNGCCRGIGNVEIEEWGVKLHGVPLYEKEGKKWVKLPSKPYQDKESGETKHAPVITILDKGKYFDLCKRIKDAIEEKIGGMNE